MSDSMSSGKLAAAKAAFRENKPKAVVAVAFLGFAAVTGAIEVLAVRGQLLFATHYMKLSPEHAFVAPLAIEGATLVSAALALWAMLKGDSYIAHEVWTAIFLGAAVLANYLGASAAGWPAAGAVYVAGMSIAALRLWHAILTRIRRDIERPVPFFRFPLMRWLLAFKETANAFRVSHLKSLSPAESLAYVNREEVTPGPVAVANGEVDLTGLTKKEAVIHAASATGGYEPSTVRAWLADREISVDNSYAASVLRTLADERRRELVKAAA